mgnify:CR=1 FL=1
MSWKNVLKMKNPVLGRMMEPLQGHSMQYKLQIVQCDVYLIKKNLIYIS